MMAKKKSTNHSMVCEKPDSTPQPTQVGERVERAGAALRECEKRLATELASMSRLQEVTARLVQGGDSTSLLLEIIDAAIAITGADLGNLQLFDRDAKALNIVASRGFEKPFLEFFNLVEHGEAACGSALKTGKRVVIDDITTSPILVGTPALDVLLAAGVRALQSTPLANRSGQVVGVLCTHYRTPRRLADRDLHILDLLARQAADWIERTQAEQALRESERSYRQLVQAMPVAVCTCDAQGRVTLYNQAAVALLGREPELGKHAWCGSWRAYRPDGTPMSMEQCPMAVTLREGRPVREEVVIELPDGTRRYLMVYPEPLFDSPGHLVGTVNMVFDITERRQAEEAVAETYRHLKLAMTAARMAAWTWDPHKDVATNTENFQEIYGLSNIKGIEQGMALVHPEDRSRHRETVEFAVEHGTPYRSVFRIIRPDNGQVVWMDERAVPVTDRDGHFVALSGVAIDITERKQAEQALLASEERLRAILDTAMDAIITIDHRGIIQSVNAATAKMFGYRMEEMIGQRVNMLMAAPHRDEHDRHIARYLQIREKHIIGTTREVPARRKDGTIFPTDLAVSEIKHLKLFTGIHRDLTERKQLERDVVEAASLEQRRIGQDLHDSVGQELTALNILAKDLAETLPTDPAAAAELVRRMAQGLQRVQREFRAVLRGLLPVAVDAQGLMAALADLTERTGRDGKVACTFDCPAPVAVADNFAATHLYLIAQEAVLNALKHAQARHIRISLMSDHALTMRVRDDGIGIGDSPTGIQGLGLRIMRNRAAIIGANLTIMPGQPEGTVVTCVFARTNHVKKDGAETGPRPDRR